MTLTLITYSKRLKKKHFETNSHLSWANGTKWKHIYREKVISMKPLFNNPNYLLFQFRINSWFFLTKFSSIGLCGKWIFTKVDLYLSVVSFSFWRMFANGRSRIEKKRTLSHTFYHLFISCFCSRDHHFVLVHSHFSIKSLLKWFKRPFRNGFRLKWMDFVYCVKERIYRRDVYVFVKDVSKYKYKFFEAEGSDIIVA